MKFSVDTTEKKITLLEPFTFKMLADLKKMIGEDFSLYSIQATEIQMVPYWNYPAPQIDYPFHAFPTTDGNFTIPCSGAVTVHN